MSLLVVEGDLLKSDCTMIMHQANCFGKMGAGIAKQVAKEYPAVYLADVNYDIPVGSKDRLGKWSGAFVTNNYTSNPQLIINLYGQYNYGRGLQTDYDALSWALSWALATASAKTKQYTAKIGVPYGMGCRLAGGDWRIVSNILEDISGGQGLDIYAYKL